MSNYIYHSDLPEAASHVPDVPADEKKKRTTQRIARILYGCLFITVAALVFAAVIFLSGSFASADESTDSNAAWKASASCSEITRNDLIY